MKKIATPHFDFESKKIYQVPQMNVIISSQHQSLLAGSVNASGLDGFGGWYGPYNANDDAD